MDLTFGDVGVFTEGTVEEVLGRARAAARVDAEAALHAEKEKRIEAERRAGFAETELEAGGMARRRRLEGIGVRVGRSVSQGLMYGGTLLLGLGVYLTLPAPFPPLPREWATFTQPAVFFVLFVFGVLSIANLSVGTTLRSALRWLEVWVSRWVEKLLVRITEPRAE